MKTNIINLTKVPVNIANGNLSLTIAPSGTVVKTRIRNRRVNSPLCDLIPIIEQVEQEVLNLPNPQPHTVYLVNKHVGAFIHGRPDVFYGVQLKAEYTKKEGKRQSTKYAGMIYTAFKPCI